MQNSLVCNARCLSEHVVVDPLEIFTYQLMNKPEKNMKKLFIALLMVISIGVNAQSLKTKNVILITLDGFRWQEVFNGPDSSLLRDKNHQDELNQIKSLFWTNNPAESRKKLLPFLWNVVGSKGEIFGNRDKRNFVNVTNKYWFSYPGYNELFTGFADESVNSNDKKNNPNISVFEVANKSEAYKNKVAAVTSWDCFPYILNADRSGIFVNSANQPARYANMSQKTELLNDLVRETAPFEDGVRYDIYTYQVAFEYIKANHPRLMFIGFDETDDYGHEGSYYRYLLSAHQSDNVIGELWTWLQSQDQYRDQTTLIITCDHGRGINENNKWHSHGAKVEGSDQTWMAIIGPDTPASGEVTVPGQIYNSQVAMTIASLLKIDYRNPNAGKSLIK